MKTYLHTQTLERPLTEKQVRAVFPNITFASPFTPPEPYAEYQQTPTPEYDLITHGVREIDPVEQDGVWVQQWEVYELDPDQVEENIAAAISEAREAAHSRINASYTQMTAELAGTYPENEQKSWPMQIEEANLVLAGSSTPTPWIDAAAAARGITRTYLATLIKAQNDAYRVYHGALTGTRQALRDQIDAVPDGPDAITTLNAINWPE